MTGEDAAEFLEAFAAEFEVDMTGIEFHKHFGPECGGPILFWPQELKEAMRDLGNYPVTIGHLVQLALAKQWICPPYRHPQGGVWDLELDGMPGTKTEKST